MVAVIVGSLVLAAAPAHADSGPDGQISVSIADVTLTGYACTTTAVTVRAEVAQWAGWTAAVVAAPTAGSRQDAAAFAGRGPSTSTGALLICPAGAQGPWTATVDTRVVLSRSRFAVGFSVTRLGTRTEIVSARLKASSVRVKGRVLTNNDLRGRAALRIAGSRAGRWRLLGHTYARQDGRFRFVAPRTVSVVRVQYLGDAVTLPSQARTRTQTVNTSSSSGSAPTRPGGRSSDL